MAGSLSLSLSQQFDSQGRPLSGGKLYFFQTGTSTPQSAFQDTALTLPHPNPMILDSSGRIAAFYLADGTIKIRLNDIGGVPVLAYDGLLVIGPSSGAGASPSVDATTVFSTGDIKKKYSTGSITGWVRCNKRTIGSATSGASERANADTQALWEFLYNADPNLTVSGGRTGNSTNDFNANKTIETPDGRGRAFAGLDDMGNAAAGRLTSSFFGASGIVLGNAGGVENQTLTTAQLPVITPTFTGTQINLGTLSANQSFIRDTGGGTPSGSGGVADDAPGATPTVTIPPFTPAGTILSFGSGTAHNNAQPTILVTFYIKL
jgi:microcystin-dependent protein